MTTTRAARRATAARTPWGSGLARAVAAAVSAVLVVVVSVSVAQAEPTSYEIFVDDAGYTGNATIEQGVERGDEECWATDGGCTLRAAIEYSNWLGERGKGPVTIRVADHVYGDATKPITKGEPLVLNPAMSPNRDNWMNTASVSAWDQGAVFEITAPVTIDLDERLLVKPRTGTTAATFHVNSSDVDLLNFKDVWGTGTSIVMGHDARNVHVRGGSSKARAGAGLGQPSRFVLYRAGARDITVSDYELEGFGTGLGTAETENSSNSSQREGLFVVNAVTVPPATAAAAVSGIVIDKVKVIYPKTAGTCSATDRSGCATNLTLFSPRIGVTLDGFALTNSVVTDMGSYNGLQFSNGGTITTGMDLSGLNISGNRFLDIKGVDHGGGLGFIVLPNRALGGAGNTISGNVFTNIGNATGQSSALYWYNGSAAVTPTSNLDITDNHFDGWGHGNTGGLYERETLRVENIGSVTVARNTFGTRTQRTGERENSPYRGMFSVLRANGQMATWRPVAAAAPSAIPSKDVFTATGAPALDTLPQCWAAVSVDQDSATTATNPAVTVTDMNRSDRDGPVTLDVYWTAGDAAELYLGSVTVPTGKSARVEFPVPIGPVELWTGSGTTVEPVAVDGDSTILTGNIRLQTHDLTDDGATVASSQLSKPVALSGRCNPMLSVMPSEAQDFPTMARDLHVTVASSQPLDAATLDKDDDLAVTAVRPGTSDSDGLNPRIISITPVAGSNGRLFDVVVRVDDTATVAVTGPGIGGVLSTAGLPSNAAAAGPAEVGFTNPLTVTPEKFLVVTGKAVPEGENGQSYQLAIKEGAPLPTEDLRFTAVPLQVEAAPDVSVSSGAPVIRKNESETQSIRVTAAAGDVAADTQVSVDHTVTSEDEAYDGLIVPSAIARLFSTDPTLSITKDAYVDVVDSSTAERVVATGRQMGTKQSIANGQEVCFVYTVKNVSKDEWLTNLTNVIVTDTDTRLGLDGVVGEVDVLPIDGVVRFHACDALIPVDTTSTGDGSESSDG